MSDVEPSRTGGARSEAGPRQATSRRAALRRLGAVAAASTVGIEGAAAASADEPSHAWTTDLPHGPVVSMRMDDRFAFTIARDGFAAVRLQDGSVAWSKQRGVAAGMRQTDDLLFGSDASEMFAVEKASGEVRWSSPAAMVVAFGDGIGVFQGNETDYALDVSDGSRLWENDTAGGAFGIREGQLFARSRDEVAVLDVDTGSVEQRWRILPGTDPHLVGPYVVARRRPDDEDGEAATALYDAATGERRWRRDGSYRAFHREQGPLLATTGGDTLVRLSPEDGTVEWRNELAPGLLYLQTFGPDRCYPTVDERVWAVGYDGEVRWTQRTPDYPSVGVHGEQVLLGTTDRVVWLTPGGEQRWEYTFDDPADNRSNVVFRATRLRGRHAITANGATLHGFDLPPVSTGESTPGLRLLSGVAAVAAGVGVLLRRRE